MLLHLHLKYYSENLMASSVRCFYSVQGSVRRLLAVLLVAFCCLPSEAQSISGTSEKTGQPADTGVPEKSSAAIRGYYVTAGDSLCVVYGLADEESYPTLLGKSSLFHPYIQVVNTCVAGLKLSQMSNLYRTTVHPYAPSVTGKPAILHFSIYGNDASHICPSGCEYTLASYEAALSSYMSEAIADGFQIEYLLQWPQAGRMQYDATRLAINTYMTPVAYGGTNTQVSWIVDATGFMKDPTNLAFYLPDGLHENAAGSTRIAAIIEQLHRTHGSRLLPLAMPK